MLWFVDHAPGDTFPRDQVKDPWFVTCEMIEELRSMPAELVEATASPSSCALGMEGMVFSSMETPIAQQLSGPIAYQEAAAALLESLGD